MLLTYVVVVNVFLFFSLAKLLLSMISFTFFVYGVQIQNMANIKLFDRKHGWSCKGRNLRKSCRVLTQIDLGLNVEIELAL